VVGGGGATALASLTDVDVSTATNAQVLTYSGGTWYPVTPTAGGSYVTLGTQQTVSAQKTWQATQTFNGPILSTVTPASVTYYVSTTGLPGNDGLTIGMSVRQVAQVIAKVPVSFRGVVNIECADGTYAGFALNDALRQGSANSTSPEHAEYQVVVYSASADPTLVTFVSKPTYGASPPDAVVSVGGSGSLKLLNVTIDVNQQSTEAGFSVGPRARGCLETVTIMDVGSMGWGVYCWGGHVRLSGTMAINANVSEPNTGWGILARSDGYVYSDCDMTMTRIARFIELADHARVDWTSGSFSGTGTVGTRSDYGFFFSSASQAHFYCGPTLSEVDTGVYLIDQSKLSVDCDMTVTSTGEGSLGIGLYGMSSLKVNIGSGPTGNLTVGNFVNGIQVNGSSSLVGDGSAGLVVNDCSNYGIHVLGFSTLDMVGAATTYSGNLQNIEFECGQLDFETKHYATSLRSATVSSTTTVYRGGQSVILVDASGGSIVLSFEMVPDALYKLKMTTDPGANTVTLQGESGNIDGAATNTTALQVQYGACEVYCDGTNLWIW
jgi:hypothetical protein